MPLLADVSLDVETVAVVGGILGVVATAVAVQWRESLRQRSDQIEDLRRQRDDLLRVLYRHGLTDHVPASVPHAAVPPTRPPDTSPGGPHNPNP